MSDVELEPFRWDGPGEYVYLEEDLDPHPDHVAWLITESTGFVVWLPDIKAGFTKRDLLDLIQGELQTLTPAELSGGRRRSLVDCGL